MHLGREATTLESEVETVRPSPASTVVLVRGPIAAREVLLLRRPTSSAVAPDAWVFPGGRLDATDRAFDLPRLATGPPFEEWDRHLGTADGIGAAFVVAALREAWEETGILLAEGPVARELEAERRAVLAQLDEFGAVLGRHGLRLATHRLRYVGRRITPTGFARRFDTRFFLAEVEPDARCTLLGTEIVEARWSSPDEALQRSSRGEMVMLPPTIDTLRRLVRGEL